jgi:hypothetical protein
MKWLSLTGKILRHCFFAGSMSLFLIPLFAQQALHFDGINDYVQTTSPGVSGSGPRTVEAWIKTTANANPSLGGLQQVITDWGTQNTGARFTFNILWGNAIRLEVSGSGLSGTIPVNDGLWHHVAGVYNPTAPNPFSLYVDGVLDIAGNITTPVNTAAGNLRIGKRVDDQRLFEGAIDEVKVWNFAKTQVQIQNGLNNELCAAQPGLIAYYTFNQGVAGGTNTGLTSLPDFSGAGNQGTLINFALTGSTSNWVTCATLNPGTGTTGTLTVAACNQYVSPSGNFTWTSSNTYQDTLQNAAGCDSILTIDLTIESPVYDTISALACDSYLSPSGNFTWTSSATYTDTLQTAAGCDSILTIHLIIDASTTATITPVSCGSYTAPSGTQSWSASGTYQDIIPNSAGCDSILTIQLTIYQPTTETVFVQECDSFVSPSGNYVWTTTGTYADTLTSVNGCDSILIVGLEIGNSTSTTIDTSTCGPYLSPSGRALWEETGTYLDTLTNSQGCPEFVTVNLNVTQIDTSVTLSGMTLTANAPGLAYQWLDCNDNFAEIFPEFSRQFNPQSAGSYAVRITKGECMDTSSCHTIPFGVGIAPNGFGQSLQVYPNPSSSGFVLDLGRRYATLAVEVHDMLGRRVLAQSHSEKEQIHLELGGEAPGTYLLTVIAEEKRAMLKLVVQ